MVQALKSETGLVKGENYIIRGVFGNETFETAPKPENPDFPKTVQFREPKRVPVDSTNQ